LTESRASGLPEQDLIATALSNEVYERLRSESSRILTGGLSVMWKLFASRGAHYVPALFEKAIIGLASLPHRK